MQVVQETPQWCAWRLARQLHYVARSRHDERRGGNMTKQFGTNTPCSARTCGAHVRAYAASASMLHLLIRLAAMPRGTSLLLGAWDSLRDPDMAELRLERLLVHLRASDSLEFQLGVLRLCCVMMDATHGTEAWAEVRAELNALQLTTVAMRSHYAADAAFMALLRKLQLCIEADGDGDGAAAGQGSAHAVEHGGGRGELSGRGDLSESSRGDASDALSSSAASVNSYRGADGSCGTPFSSAGSVGGAGGRGAFLIDCGGGYTPSSNF
eukprot:6210903-Pleurochrysis_carterae.AAC.2